MTANEEREELRRKTEALERIKMQMNTTSSVYKIAKEALNPPQEFEDVEVFIRAGSEPNTIWFVDPEDGYTKQLDRNTDVTIKFQRPKPRKVKRREEITIDNPILNVRIKSASGGPSHAKFYAEWEE